jgi:hypothetical protein
LRTPSKQRGGFSEAPTDLDLRRGLAAQGGEFGAALVRAAVHQHEGARPLETGLDALPAGQGPGERAVVAVQPAGGALNTPQPGRDCTSPDSLSLLIALVTVAVLTWYCWASSRTVGKA